MSTSTSTPIVVRHGRGSELASVAQVVDRHGQPVDTGELGGELELAGPDDLIGDENALDPAAHHRLRLEDRRGRHADRAVLDLEPRELHRLVGLDVRP